MKSVSRLARMFCTTTAASPAAITVEATASVPKTAKKHGSMYKTLRNLGGRVHKIEETLNQIFMEGTPIQKHELVRYAKDLRKSHLHQRALEIFDWMERKDVEFSASDHAVRLGLIAKTKGLEAAESYFNNLDPSNKNQSCYGSLLNCYCVDREVEKANAHFEEMDNLGFVSNSLSYDNLMGMYLRLRQPEKVPELVAAMKQKNISPCDVTYSMWIQSCGKLNDLDGVEKVIEEMKLGQGKDRSSWETFANLAAIYTKSGLYSKAEEALKSVEEKINPNTDSRTPYHYLINLYTGISKPSEVYRVWDLLKKAHPQVNNLSVFTMIQALSKLEDNDGIKKIFTEWESKCWTYDIRMATVMINSYLKQNMYEEAEDVLKRAMEKCKGQFSNSKCRQLLMMYLLKNDKADLALKQFEEAVLDQEKNWSWSVELISSFFVHFEKSKDIDGAEEFCQTLRKWSPLDSATYSLLIKTYVAAEKACPDMRKRLKEDGIEVDEELEGLLSKICP